MGLRRSASKSYMWFFGVLLLSLISIIVSASYAEDGIEVFLFSFAILSMTVVFLPIPYNGNFFLFEPLSFVAFSVVFGLGLKTFYVVYGLSTNSLVTDRLMDTLTIRELQKASLVLFVGLLCFAIGYCRRSTKNVYHIRNTKDGLSRNRVVLVSLIFFFVAVGSFIIFIVKGNFGFSSLADLSQKRFQSGDLTAESRLSDLNYYFYRVALIVKAPMYFLFYLMVRRNLKLTSTVGLFFLATLFLTLTVPFFISNKAGIILPLADLAIIAFFITGRVNLVKLAIYAAPLLFTIAIIAAFRGGETVVNYTFADKVFGGRYFVGVTKSAHIINTFPDYIDYFYGKSLVGWMNIFLPSSLDFDSIYFTGVGQYLGRNVFGFVKSGVPPGILSELYMNFGMVGVTIGMYFVGLLLRSLHLYGTRKIGDPVSIIYYALITVRLPTFLFNNGVTVALLKLAADLIIVTIFVMLVKSRVSVHE